MRKEYRVNIPEVTSNNVERCFYEHAAGKDNIAFLMKDNDVRWDILQQYIDIVECRFVELEMLKKKISEAYKPEEIGEYPFSFEFDFDNSQIIYTIEI